MKNLSKEEIYNRFLNFCDINPVGIPHSIVIEFNMDLINELLSEGKLATHNMGIGGIFYTLTDSEGNPIYKKSW
jgi:hypothetical protein